MHRPDLPLRAGLVLVVVLATFLLGYPAAYLASHGLDARVWPALRGTPADWFTPEGSGLRAWLAAFVRIAGTYLNMALGRAQALPGGGREAFVLVWGAAIALGSLILMGGRLVPLRHRLRRFGDAQFASPRALARMRKGIELGLDPDTGRAVRVQVEGNLLTIAPPRTGKTSGLILPNLAFPEPEAWAGPAVVIDPKGDVVRAVRRRRESMGQTVYVLDPLSLAHGTDRWDPLLGLDPEDVLELQSMARALLPETGQTSDAGAFFRDRAGVLIVAALQCVIRAGQGAPEAAALVRDPEALRAALEGHGDAVACDARGILDSDDEKSRASILTTAAQGFSWMLDPRMQRIVTGHSFRLNALCAGDADLYIVLPADDRRKEMAPYVRWLLAALFSTVRRRPVAERLLVIIDEAYVLGRFDAVLRGAGELPGYGVSLWTFWQSEAQIVDTYGEAGAAILRDTAEALMLFNLSGAQGAERERWSNALGTFTGVQETISRDPTTGRETKSVAPGPEALVPASELARLTQRHSLVFLNSAAYTTDPLKLRKTFAHRDARFAGLLDPVAPVRATA
ncbi:type IV secretory system conjugative DNA transfer family protein [Methylobacterium sp. DB0501]|jgi:type IV secretion system protein VirD4|uniref:type IV secretory system conjugative DNA transfer family protein n=1 Tax=Methylobacterium sp. DB0501 TaxID=2709665 RepID=UPI0013EBCFF5|nr:type IV secretory system conjugative DNA transfer family protein [Methylobacterium sp. DB0501]NGM38524.1 type IV secretory system conjugative DNA transfer family protein [Methylobacterium sp. DB0501]